MKRRYIIIALLLLSFMVYGKDKDTKVVRADSMPKNVKIIDISTGGYDYVITMIDLSNNEIVTVYYTKYSSAKFNVKDIIRTGIFVNPDDYNLTPKKE